MEFREVVRRRHMTRTYEPRPIPHQVLDRILDAGRRAPSAGFAQGVTLLVLSAPEDRQSFWTQMTSGDPRPGGRWDRLRAAPVIVLPLTDPQVYLSRYSEPDKAGLGMETESGWPVPYWEVDAAFATMSMLLAATDEGVGALFFALAHRAVAVLQQLGVPDRVRTIGALTLGPPGRDDPASPSLRRGRRPEAETIHWGRWAQAADIEQRVGLAERPQGLSAPSTHMAKNCEPPP